MKPNNYSKPNNYMYYCPMLLPPYSIRVSSDGPLHWGRGGPLRGFYYVFLGSIICGGGGGGQHLDKLLLCFCDKRTFCSSSIFVFAASNSSTSLLTIAMTSASSACLDCNRAMASAGKHCWSSCAVRTSWSKTIALHTADIL